MSRRNWMLMALLAATWGGSYALIKVALRDVGPGGVVCIRTALAAAILLPVAARRGALGVLRGRAGDVVVLAVIQVVAPFLLITVGERHVPSAMAGVLVAAAPIWTAVFALRSPHAERSTGWGLLGILVGIVGVALLFGLDLSGDATTALAGAGILLASLGYGLGGIELKRRFGGADPSATAGATMALSAVGTLPLLALDAPSSVSFDVVAALLVLGAVGTGLAFLVYYTLIDAAGPSRASLVAYIAPGFAVVYGALFLGESITAGTVAGLVLILAGSYLGINGRPPGRDRLTRSGPSRSSARAPVRAR